jgi:hypothetical protein
MRKRSSILKSRFCVFEFELVSGVSVVDKTEFIVVLCKFEIGEILSIYKIINHLKFVLSQLELLGEVLFVVIFFRFSQSFDFLQVLCLSFIESLVEFVESVEGGSIVCLGDLFLANDHAGLLE